MALESPNSSKRDVAHRELEKDTAPDASLDAPVAWTPLRAIAAVALMGVYMSSQLPLYFIGASLTYVVEDIGGETISSWLPTANTLTIAAIAPFCGYLEDAFGRRNITIFGLVLLIVGQIVLGTAHHAGQAIAGMSIAGAGAAIGELSALAGLAEIVPVAQRGIFHGFLTLIILPFTPYVLYAQLLSVYVTWRWGIWISLIVTGLATVGTVAAYFPRERQTRSLHILARDIDWIGGVLLIVGITIFLVALQAGGYTHPWTSAYVLVQLILGVVLVIAFVVWEAKFAPHPIIPGRLFHGQHVVAIAFLVSFVAGMNFYSILNFYPLVFSNVYNPDPVQVGLKGLGYGISTTAGATFINTMVSVLRGHNRELLTISAILMTAFGGALAAITPSTPGMAVAFGTIASFGIGGLLVPPVTMSLYVVPDDLLATASALGLSFRFIGGSIGYTIYYAIFTNKLNASLPVEVGTAAVKAGLPASSATSFVTALLAKSPAVAQVPGVTMEVIAAATVAAQGAFAAALSYVWYASIPFGILSIICCLALPSVSSFMTDRVAVNIRYGK